MENPNRIVIETGLTCPFITAIRAERPQEVVVIVYSLETNEATAYNDVQPLGVEPPPEAIVGEWVRARPRVEYEVGA